MAKENFEYLDRGKPGDRCFLIGCYGTGENQHKFIEYLVVDELTKKYRSFGILERCEAEHFLKRTRGVFGWFWRLFIKGI